jgi:hypothetical protein
MLIYLVVMGLQRCRQAARLFQAVQTPWLAAASCSVGKLPAGVGSAAQRQACHYAAAAADPLETQQVAGGGARCGPGSDTGLAQTQQQPTSIPCRDRLEWSTSTFDRCRLSSSRAYRTSSLASRQAQDDLVEDAAVRQQPHAVDESAAAEVGGAHACPEPAAGEQQSVIVGGPAAQGASAVTRLLVQEAGLSQQEAEKAVDRIVHYYVSSGGVSKLLCSLTLPTSPFPLLGRNSPCPVCCMPVAAPPKRAAACVCQRGAAGGPGAAPAARFGPAPLPDTLAAHPG